MIKCINIILVNMSCAYMNAVMPEIYLEKFQRKIITLHIPMAYGYKQNSYKIWPEKIKLRIELNLKMEDLGQHS